MLGGVVAAYVKGLQGRIGKQEQARSEYQVYVAEHYASKEFLSDLKREITESIRDLGRRIDHVFHSDRDYRAKLPPDAITLVEW
jgi:hypothetical protein